MDVPKHIIVARIVSNILGAIACIAVVIHVYNMLPSSHSHESKQFTLFYFLSLGLFIPMRGIVTLLEIRSGLHTKRFPLLRITYAFAFGIMALLIIPFILLAPNILNDAELLIVGVAILLLLVLAWIADTFFKNKEIQQQ